MIDLRKFLLTADLEVLEFKQLITILPNMATECKHCSYFIPNFSPIPGYSYTSTIRTASSAGSDSIAGSCFDYDLKQMTLIKTVKAFLT